MDITGHLPDLYFSLTADNGKQVTEHNYRGNIVLLYFGFAGCSLQCPLTMGQLTSVLQRLGHDADHVRVAFISVNPVYDIPQMLHDYLHAFDPVHMVGLTGNESAIESLAQRYRASFQRNPSNSGIIAHSNLIYIFDPAGHARFLATPQDSNDAIVTDIRQLFHAFQ